MTSTILHARAIVFACLLAVIVASWTAAAGTAATSSVVVQMSVPSATQLTSTCAGAGSGGELPFGTVLPDTPALTSPCTITFGSSNDTAALRVFQADGGGTAMWRFGTGGLDTGWGTAGSVAVTLASSQTIYGASAQRDGKVLATGGEGGSLLVMRTDTTGAPDAAFDGDGGSGNGRVTIATPTGATGLEVFEDSAGRIVIGARASDSSVMYAVRLLADGRLDTSFDGDGIASVDVSGGQEFLESMAVMADDRIVLAGCTTTGGGCAGGVATAIVRYDVNGRLDSTFDGDGIVVDDILAGADNVEDVVVDASNRVYVTGELASQSFVARYTSGGARDTGTFGAPNGYLRWDAIAGGDNTTAAALLPDGRITVVGNNTATLYADRLTTAGALDPTWSSGDIVVPGASAYPEGSLLLGDGTLMATGFVGAAPGTDQFAARWTSTGAADLSFTGDGSDVQSRAGGAVTDNAAKLVPFRDGRIAMVGYAQPGANLDLTITMYDDGGSVTNYADASADWNTASTTSMFGVCLQSTSATNDWPTTGACPTSDGTNWRPLPQDTTDPNAKASHTAVSNTQNQTATFRFGIRPSSSQSPGTYWVDAVFEVTAPNA